MSVPASSLLVVTTGNINRAPIEGPWGVVILAVVILMLLVVSVMIFITTESIWKNDKGVFRVVFLTLFGLTFLVLIVFAVCFTVVLLRGYL